jgi:hypothetical protein
VITVEEGNLFDLGLELSEGIGTAGLSSRSDRARSAYDGEKNRACSADQLSVPDQCAV